jgi:hypothetical protein
MSDTVPVIWYVYSDLGDVATDGPVNPEEAGISIPGDILEWAGSHGLSEDDPDVYVLVATDDDAPYGGIAGQLAAREGTVSARDARLITALLERERASRAENRA